QAALAAAKPRRAVPPPPRAAGAALKVLAPLEKRFGPGLGDLAKHWPSIVGEKLARLSKPVKLSRGPGGGTLTLAAPSAATAVLKAQADMLIQSVNRRCGAGTVKRLAFTPGPVGGSAKPAAAPARRSARGLDPQTLAKIEADAQAVDDDALSRALARFGKGVYARNRM
ncbi:MAG: DciA family protein, partial [Maricaulaceae bacterium]